jgi:ribosomal protein S12 methylthiotransferase accessory factor YcaO
MKSASTLLSSSQLLAKSHRFTEAIAMRDKARAMQSRVRHPTIKAIDTEYQEQFRQTLSRHKCTLKDLVAQHEALLKFLAEKRDAANRTAEADSDVRAAYASVEIIDVAMGDDQNQDVCIPVVRHFSPKKSASRSRGSASLRADEEEEDDA